MKNTNALIGQKASMNGFIVMDYEHQYHLAEKQLGAWLKSGQIKRRETRYKGIDQCPMALMNLFKGV